MSAQNSEHVTESGRSDSASSPHAKQDPSFASLGSQEIHSRIQDWSADESSPGPGFAVQAYSYARDPASIPRSLPAVQSTAQSMASLDSSITESMPSMSSGSSSGSESSLRSSAAGLAVRPGPFDDDGYYVGSTASDVQTDNSSDPDNDPSKGVPCLFGFLNCRETFTNIGRWNEHCKSHFKGKAPPKELRCPYSWCAWTTLGQDGEAAWYQRRVHFDQEHDVLSCDEGLSDQPDIALFKYLWSVHIITDVQLLELRQSGRLGLDSTPFAVPQKPDRSSRPRRAALRR
jgi:hypothetical protein